MRTDELLEQCLQALLSGEELSPDLARYLALHPQQREEVEALLYAAQRVSRVSKAELPAASRARMQARLAARLGFDPSSLAARPSLQLPEEYEHAHEHEHSAPRKPLLSIGRVSLARLRYAPPPADDASEKRIREVFGGLTPEEIRRYIGVRGEAYLYYRQKLPGWEPVLSFIAVVLRGLKRLESLARAA